MNRHTIMKGFYANKFFESVVIASGYSFGVFASSLVTLVAIKTWETIDVPGKLLKMFSKENEVDMDCQCSICVGDADSYFDSDDETITSDSTYSRDDDESGFETESSDGKTHLLKLLAGEKEPLTKNTSTQTDEEILD